MAFIFVLWTLLALCAAIVVLLVIRSGFTASLDFVNKYPDPIKLTLLIIAAVYTAGVFYIEMLDRRIANTLAFQQQAESGHLQNASNTIDMFWIRGDGRPILEWFRTVEEYAISNDHLKRANRLWAKKTKQLVTKLAHEDEVFAIFDFYRDIVVCVDQGRCHRRTACRLFATDMENFRLTYRAFISEWEYLWGSNLTNVLKYFPSRCR